MVQVCVVEDDAAIRQTLRALLEFEGYEVVEAADGVDALELLRAAPSPLVVLLDFLMPGMNGPTLLQTAAADPRLAGRHAYVLLTAATHSLTPALTEMLEAISVPVLAKPFDADVLLQVVDKAVRSLVAESQPRN